jgi:AcrR family transcriptional regulator
MSITERYEKRRLEVSDAAWRTIVEEGLDRTSVRAVAQRLGCSTGVVMHYFRNMDELMLLALERVVTKHIALTRKETEGYEGVERLVRILCTAMPTDAKAAIGWRIWLAFLGHAVGHPKLMTAHRRRYKDLREFLTRELGDLQAQGLLRPGLDLRFEVSILISLVDGASIGSIIDPKQVRPQDLHRIVRRYVEGLLART